MARGFRLGLVALFLSIVGGASMSPVSRVVQLLQGIAQSIETEAKAEEDLYETFVCWAKSIIGQKTRSNSAASERIEELETYVKDLEAGRIELTTERVDLEKEIETLKGELEVATQLREKEASDFATAKDEMDKAIAALEDAIEVLKDATAEHKEGVLLALRGSALMGATERSREAAKLHLAVELGQRMLTSGDAVFLQRLLTGEVPDRASWKKLNRKATFKMDYKARSFKIQGVLAKMLETFSINLKDATEKEKEAIAMFGELKSAKGEELKAAEDALSKMAAESGARGLSKEQAKTEIKQLKKQVSDDEKYIGQVEDALVTKKSEWKMRKALRAGELGAISKAISILHSDDARDTFKKSFASQGFLFFQEGAASGLRQRRSAASAELRAAATASSDSRIVELAAGLDLSSAKGHFDEVVAAIDSMVETLQAEEAMDLKTKETCEKDRADDTRTAIKASRTMDEHTEAIVELESRIEELTKLIEEKQAAIAEIMQQLKEAKEMRAKENAEYKVAKKDDEEAAAIVASAQGVLEKFYVDAGLMLVQSKKAPFESVAGEAPPPPPPTWDGGYGGKTNEQAGIVAILAMIREDILKDIRKADKEEADALALYTKTKTGLDAEKKDLEGEITTAQKEKAIAEQDVEDNKGGRSTKRGELEVVMKKIKDTEPNCAYFQINYPLRAKNRQIEVDGLTKAKAILQGGRFDGLPDPDREIKPGDALLQLRPQAVARQMLRLRALA